LTETPDGRILIKATALDSNELRWWLLGFGDKVEGLGPERLRGEFNTIASRLAKRYQTS
jgi:predicted DNA-binding transcriptional regulator YafY